LKQAERIREEAGTRRQELNQEMGGVAEKLEPVVLTFPARASETGKLYGSITTQMIAEALSEKVGVEITRRQIDSQPLRALGEHKVHVRLTVDLVPEVSVIVHREGEAPLAELEMMAPPVQSGTQSPEVSPEAEPEAPTQPEESETVIE
jgi:large subunit ribosomal protein L9